LFEGEFLLAQRQGSARGQPEAVQTARVNGHGKMPGSNGPHEPPAGDRESLSTSMHPPLEPGSKSRAIAQRFCAFPILTRACLTAWAGTKRDCGVKRRKQFGLLTL
jgi:hypothetical protein